MINKGWIKLHRKITEWEWYDDIPTKVLFIHLLLTVNIKDDDWHGVHVPRGSRVTSISKLAEETKLTIRQTRTALEHLLTTHEVTKHTTARYTLISVVNYNSYQADRQSERQEERQTNDTLSDKQPTNNRPTTDNSIRIQEYKNIRREEDTTVVNAREEFCRAIESEFGKLTGKLVSSTDARLIYQLYDGCTDTALIIEAMQIAAKTYKPKYNGDRIYSFKFFLTAINEAIAKKSGGNTDNGEFSRIQYTQGISNRFGVPEEEFI